MDPATTSSKPLISTEKSSIIEWNIFSRKRKSLRNIMTANIKRENGGEPGNYSGLQASRQ